MRFRNKVALIATAANGIGRATTEIMARMKVKGEKP
jgi:NAD(P)-dependent dehydrogenase (short-subunit alcohol dehydrogenase family)